VALTVSVTIEWGCGDGVTKQSIDEITGGAAVNRSSRVVAGNHESILVRRPAVEDTFTQSARDSYYPDVNTMFSAEILTRPSVEVRLSGMVDRGERIKRRLFSRLNIVDELGAVVAGLVLATGIILRLVANSLTDGAAEVSAEAGYVLIGTVAVTFLYEMAVRRRHDEALIALIESSLVPGATRFGLVRMQSGVNLASLCDSLDSGDELLWLTSYNASLSTFETRLRAALERGARIRMLVVNPNSQVAAFRALELKDSLGFSVEEYRLQARGYIERLRQQVEQVSPSFRLNLEIRTFRDLLCVPMYIHRRRDRPIAALTTYFLGTGIHDQIHLEWATSPDSLLWRLEDYFNHKWAANHSNSVDFAKPFDAVSNSGSQV
jgi:hypothetical protein